MEECQESTSRCGIAPNYVFIYANYMLEGLNSYINFFADDGKIMKQTVNTYKCRELQEDLDKSYR